MQRRIALWFNVPQRLAHTINVEKALKYIQHLGTPEHRLERFLDNLEGIRMARLRDHNND